jgi:hypothetical protein
MKKIIDGVPEAPRVSEVRGNEGGIVKFLGFDNGRMIIIGGGFQNAKVIR